MSRLVTKYFFFAFFSAACFSVSRAQTIEESMTVEGRYTPEVIAADRLSATPAFISVSAPEANLAYDLSGVPAAFQPDALSLPATGWKTDKIFDSSRGYLDISLGSWLNSSLSAGFNAFSGADTKLRFWLQHNSTSLWQAWKGDAPAGVFGADRRYRYDESLGVNLSHIFAGKGRLAADIRYHLGCFNYYVTSLGETADDHFKAPSQTINDVSARLAWNGTTTGNFGYGVFADFRYFGFRDAYQHSFPVVPDARFVRLKGARESSVNVGGNLSYSLSRISRLELGGVYSGVLNSSGNDVNLFRLSPAYICSTGNFSFRLGAEVAVVDDYKTRFRAAPDVSLSFKNGAAAFVVALGGGTQLRTLAWKHQMDYYGDPEALCWRASYSPLDARIAFQYNPGGRFTLGAEGVWRTVLDEYLGGTYQCYLNDVAIGPLPSRLHGFSIGVNAGYCFSKYFSVNAKGNWQPQHGNSGFLNGFDRPALTASISAVSCPVDALKIGLGYDLRARRALLRGNISRLNLNADYRLSPRFTVGAQLYNLLNRYEFLLPNLPSEGFNASASLQVVF